MFRARRTATGRLDTATTTLMLPTQITPKRKKASYSLLLSTLSIGLRHYLAIADVTYKVEHRHITGGLIRE